MTNIDLVVPGVRVLLPPLLLVSGRGGHGRGVGGGGAGLHGGHVNIIIASVSGVLLFQTVSSAVVVVVVVVVVVDIKLVASPAPASPVLTTITCPRVVIRHPVTCLTCSGPVSACLV